LGYSSFIRGFFNKKLFKSKKNILPSDLFVKQINSATPEQEGRFHHGQIIQAWVVYSSFGKSFKFNCLINVNQIDILFKTLVDNEQFIYICH
jgi:hypothetical protein